MMDPTDDAVEEQPAPHPPGSVYRVVYLKVDDNGQPTIWPLRDAKTLPAKIYDRSTAIKYATFEAQKLPKATIIELMVALITPAGRCAAVLAGGTGKPVRPLIALRTKRALVTLMPNEVKVKRRTSRSLVGVRPAARPGKRRSSRGRA